MNAGKVFDKVLGDSRNFMTPDIITRQAANQNTVYELSEGEGFNRDPIYGVTVLRKDGEDWTHDYDSSKMFHSKADAQAYINEL